MKLPPGYAYKVHMKHNWILSLGMDLIPKIFCYAYVNDPKFKIIQKSQTFLITSILDKECSYVYKVIQSSYDSQGMNNYFQLH